MEALGQYVVSLAASSLICGILLSFFPEEGMVRKLLRLACAVFLAVMALSPLPGLKVPEVTRFEDFLSAGEDLAAQGEAMGSDWVRDGIKAALDAYILDKAAALDMTITPDTKLGADDLPAGVTIRGIWTEESRETLMAIITKDLGVPEEDQQWNMETGESASGNGRSGTGGQP